MSNVVPKSPVHVTAATRESAWREGRAYGIAPLEGRSRRRDAGARPHARFVDRALACRTAEAGNLVFRHNGRSRYALIIEHVSKFTVLRREQRSQRVLRRIRLAFPMERLRVAALDGTLASERRIDGTAMVVSRSVAESHMEAVKATIRSTTAGAASRCGLWPACGTRNTSLFAMRAAMAST
jgi:hypothetical protein